MNTDRVTPEGAVRTASATIAWLRLPRSRSRRGAREPWRPPRDRRHVASAASVAIEDLGVARTARRARRQAASASARSPGRRRRLDRVDRQADAPKVGRASCDDPRRPSGLDDADFAAGWQVAERVEGRLLGRREAIRLRDRSAPMLADVSTTSTMSRARPAGRSRNGRAASRTRMMTSRSWSRNSRLRRRRCHGAFASTSATSRCQSSVEGTGRLLATQPEQVHRDRPPARTAGRAGRAGSISGMVAALRRPTRAPVGGEARRRSGR